MTNIVAWLRGDTLSAKALRTFVYTFVGVILFNWNAGSGPDAHHISGLGNAVSQQWDAAAGTGFIAMLGTLGLTGLLQKS